MATAETEVQNVVGRLVEVRVRTLRNLEDVAALGGAMQRVVQPVKGAIVVCADYRDAGVLSQEVADAFLGILATYNARIERSGMLLSTQHATFNLQIERIVREAAHPARRTFRVARELSAWLGEVLGPGERVRLSAFLGSPPA
jgi:hypothetical protein